jgi:formiminoglutamase
MVELFSKEEANKIIKVREGETKLGESVIMPHNSLHESLAQFKGRYVIMGVPEDIGPSANFGKKGARYTWQHFLQAFLNIQDNDFMPNEEIMILGHLAVDDLLNTADQLDANIPEELQRLRELVAIIDERLERAVKAIVNENKIPIVIGGGHNNAYGIIAGTVSAMQENDNHVKPKLAVINLDPHADFRPLEGRHSGNSFSYAFNNQLLNKYHVVGLHENYNSNNFINHTIKYPEDLSFYTFEQWLDHPISTQELAKQSIEKVKDQPVGLEIDLDSVCFFPSSAKTPSGWTVDQIRAYIREMGRQKNIAYLHLTESAPSSNEKDEGLTGKSLSYFVSDFVKNHHLTFGRITH